MRAYSARDGPNRSAISVGSSQRWKRDERLAGRRLLRGLLRPADAAPVAPAGERDLGDEVLRVIGSRLLDEGVERRLAEKPLRHLLQSRLVVAEPDGQVLLDVGREVSLDDGARRLVARVGIHGAEQGLIGRREDRHLLAPAALLLA